MASRWTRIRPTGWRGLRGVRGLYAIYVKRRLRYIGQSKDLAARLWVQLRTDPCYDCQVYVAPLGERFWVKDVRVKWRAERRPGERLMAEERLIDRLTPPDNTRVGRTHKKGVVHGSN